MNYGIHDVCLYIIFMNFEVLASLKEVQKKELE